MTSCVENLSDDCYKNSIVVPKQPIGFSEIKEHVKTFQKELDEKYPWRPAECKKCEYIDQIKNPEIGNLEVLKSKERFRLIFNYFIYTKVLQDPVNMIPGVSNLEFIKISDVCKCIKCNNSFKNTYIYKYGNNDFICINCVIKYLQKKSKISIILSEILFYDYHFAIKNDNKFELIGLTSSSGFTCDQCKNKYNGDDMRHLYLDYGSLFKRLSCCLSCAVSFKTENVQTPQIESTINTPLTNLSNTPSPKRSKRQSPKRSKRGSSKSSKRQSPKRSKRGSSKRSKKNSLKGSKKNSLKGSKKSPKRSGRR